MEKFLPVAAAAAACVLGSSAAMAALVTVSENGVVVATWEQSLTPTPTYYVLGGETDFAMTNPTGKLALYTDVAWFNSINNGLFQAGNFNLSGPQAYTGDESAPVFQPGVYQGTDIGLNYGAAATVTIAVPEAATWAMMLAGFGVIGIAARARRNVSVKYA